MRPPRTADQRPDEGFTITELMVSLLVFATVIVGLAASLGIVLEITRANRNRSVAAYLATQELEQARRVSFQSLVDEPVVERTEGIFRIRREAQPVVAGADEEEATGCVVSSGGGTEHAVPPSALRVSVTITWPDMGPVKPVRNDTVVTPIYGSASQITGGVVARIEWSDGEPAEGLTVRLSGGSGSFLPRTGVTGSAGCVEFPFVPGGDYTVAVVDSTLIDNDNFSPPAGRTVNVGLGRRTDVTLQVDHPITVQPVTASGLPSGTLIPTGVQVTAASSSNGTKVIPNSGVSGSTAPGTWPSFKLFPSPSSYQLWTGTCPDSLHPNGAATVNAQGGQTVSPALRFGYFTLSLTNRQSGRTYSLEAAYGGSGSCSEKWTFALPSGSGTGTSRIALPWGRWNLTVRRSGSSQTKTATVTLTPGQSAPTVSVSAP